MKKLRDAQRDKLQKKLSAWEKGAARKGYTPAIKRALNRGYFEIDYFLQGDMSPGEFEESVRSMSMAEAETLSEKKTANLYVKATGEAISLAYYRGAIDQGWKKILESALESVETYEED